MPATKPTNRARPVTSVPPISPRAEDSQGYRRGRAIRSCLECRRRKMRCNRSRPCQNCNRFCRECVYLPFPEWPSGVSNPVRQDVNAQSPIQGGGRTFPSFDATHNFGHVQLSSFTNHDYGSGSDTLARLHRNYETDTDDDFNDVALQIGRLSITEKFGGYFKPHIASQIAVLLSKTNHTLDPFNSQSPYGIPAAQHPTRPAASSTFPPVRRTLPLEPSPGFSTAWRPYLPQPGPQLPSCSELSLLYGTYWSAVDPLAHIIHKPSFEAECLKYMLNGYVIDAAPVSFKALLLAMCLAAAVSLPIVQQKELSGINIESLVGRLKIATEKALTDADFMTSIKIQTLQAFTVYLMPQCRAEISKSHIIFIRQLVHLAISTNLNRDPSGPGMSPVDCQVRRLLWHQICCLDVLTAEAQGPHSSIRDEQFKTSLPLNINDDALGRPNESTSASFWTDATFSIIRYECCMVHRLILGQRWAMELGQTDFRTAQHLVSAEKKRIERGYLRYLDEAIPIQRCAKLVGRLFIARFDAMLLRKNSQFDINTELQASERETLIQSCLTVCESAVSLDTDREMANWTWYARAHHQYERSIILLMEIHRDPLTSYSERINQVLDHVFGATSNMDSRERSRSLLQLLVDEFDKMIQLRKVKIPQLAISDNGSTASSNDHSGMVSTPEDGQQWNQWQPEAVYGPTYRRDLPPVSDGMWWPTPAHQQGMLELSAGWKALQHPTSSQSVSSVSPAVTQNDDYANTPHDDYGYVMGLGPA